MSLQHNSENCALIASFSFPRPGSVGLKSSLDSLESFGKAFRGAANRSGVLCTRFPVVWIVVFCSCHMLGNLDPDISSLGTII